MKKSCKELYPRLSEKHNRTKKLRLEEVIYIHDALAKGYSVKEIAGYINAPYHRVYYHAQSVEKRELRTNRSREKERERMKSDLEFRKRRHKKMDESRKYRASVHGQKWREWANCVQRNYDYRRKLKVTHIV